MPRRPAPARSFCGSGQKLRKSGRPSPVTVSGHRSVGHSSVKFDDRDDSEELLEGETKVPKPALAKQEGVKVEI
jgi:hypothetical protein